MKDKFKEYLLEIGLRYAVTFARYERIRLSTIQLWCYEIAREDNSLPELDTAEVARIYNTAGDYSNEVHAS